MSDISEHDTGLLHALLDETLSDLSPSQKLIFVQAYKEGWIKGQRHLVKQYDLQITLPKTYPSLLGIVANVPQ